MDLQAKLVNDGWTQPHVSPETLRVPDWANWRDEAFGFTLEPAVIVYRRGGLAEAEIPRSRPDLLRLLQAPARSLPPPRRDLRHRGSGVGYLFAAQDSVLSSQFWRLTIALGDVDVRLLPTSGAILDAIERGEVLVGYNVLGSYARARQQAGAPVGIVLPRDYTLLMSRVVAIPKAAPPSGAGQAVRRLPAFGAWPGRRRRHGRAGAAAAQRRYPATRWACFRQRSARSSRSRLGRRCWSSSTG